MSRTKELIWPGAESGRERRRYCASAFMPENNDEPDAEMIDSLFDGPQSIVIHRIAGRAHDKEVADVLIDDERVRAAGVYASQIPRRAG